MDLVSLKYESVGRASGLGPKTDPSLFTTEFFLNSHFEMRTNRATHGRMYTTIYFLSNTLISRLVWSVFSVEFGPQCTLLDLKLESL